MSTFTVEEAQPCAGRSWHDGRMNISPQVPENIAAICLRWADVGRISAARMPPDDALRRRLLQASDTVEHFALIAQGGSTIFLINPALSYAKISLMAAIMETVGHPLANQCGEVGIMRAWLDKNAYYAGA